jgi:hypothetical protein
MATSPAQHAELVAAIEAAHFGDWCASFRGYLASLPPDKKAELRARIAGSSAPRPQRVLRVVAERPLRGSA